MMDFDNYDTPVYVRRKRQNHIYACIYVRNVKAPSKMYVQLKNVWLDKTIMYVFYRFMDRIRTVVK